jgi:hypothetical protein
MEECERDIAKQLILLAVRFEPIIWDATMQNILTVADPPVTGDMIRVLC